VTIVRPALVSRLSAMLAAIGCLLAVATGGTGAAQPAGEPAVSLDASVTPDAVAPGDAFAIEGTVTIDPEAGTWSLVLGPAANISFAAAACTETGGTSCQAEVDPAVDTVTFRGEVAPDPRGVVTAGVEVRGRLAGDLPPETTTVRIPACGTMGTAQGTPDAAATGRMPQAEGTPEGGCAGDVGGVPIRVAPAPTEEPPATPTATSEPSATPTVAPAATAEPTVPPTVAPTEAPTEEPSATVAPTATPEPTATTEPTTEPTATATTAPTATTEPTEEPTEPATATTAPTQEPTAEPSATTGATATSAPTATMEPSVTSTAEPRVTDEPTDAATATTEPAATSEPTAGAPRPTPDEDDGGGDTGLWVGAGVLAVLAAATGVVWYQRRKLAG